MRFMAWSDEGVDLAQLADATLLARDGSPLAGEIKAKPVGEGAEAGVLITARWDDPVTAALALTIDLGEVGRIRLQTTLLPPREEPYGLMYELARHRVKAYLAKGEEWGMWDRDAAPEAMARFERARELLGRASTEESPKAMSRLARRSLQVAVDASERLAASHARTHLARKYAAKGAPATAIGAVLAPRLTSKLLEQPAIGSCGLVSMPLRWRDVEPRSGQFDWSRLDRWMVALSKTRHRVMMGPLVDVAPENLPDWVLAWRGDANRFRETIYAWCEQVVGRYRGAVSLWNIASGFAGASGALADPERAITLTRLASVLVRQLHPSAPILVEIRDPFGESLRRHPDSMGPWRYLRRIVEEGIHFDSVGIRLTMGESVRPCRDLFELACLADRFVSPDRHMVVTELSAPSSPSSIAEGRWRGEWSPSKQAAWLAEAYAILLARPRYDAVLWGRVADEPDSGSAGLFDATGRGKPSVGVFEATGKALRMPRPQLPPGLLAPSESPAAAS